jgi:hypothetical protein
MAPSQNPTETSVIENDGPQNVDPLAKDFRNDTEYPTATDPPAGIEAPTASPKDGVSSPIFFSLWAGLIFSAPMFFLSL